MTSPRAAAFFDVDGTLAATNVLIVFASLQRSRLRGILWWAWLLSFFLRSPYYGFLDLYDRRLFNRLFVRNYRGVTLREIEAWQEREAPAFWTSKLFPGAVQEAELHKREGRVVVILSGGMAPMLRPLQKILDAKALYAVQPEVVDGRLTGRIVGAHPVKEGKADVLRQAAVELGTDLRASYAYADHFTDRAFLASVGHPVAVNPSSHLEALARVRRWRICRWKRAA